MSLDLSALRKHGEDEYTSIVENAFSTQTDSGKILRRILSARDPFDKEEVNLMESVTDSKTDSSLLPGSEAEIAITDLDISSNNERGKSERLKQQSKQNVSLLTERQSSAVSDTMRSVDADEASSKYIVRIDELQSIVRAKQQSLDEMMEENICRSRFIAAVRSENVRLNSELQSLQQLLRSTPMVFKKSKFSNNKKTENRVPEKQGWVGRRNSVKKDTGENSEGNSRRYSLPCANDDETQNECCRENLDTNDIKTQSTDHANNKDKAIKKTNVKSKGTMSMKERIEQLIENEGKAAQLEMERDTLKAELEQAKGSSDREDVIALLQRENEILILKLISLQQILDNRHSINSFAQTDGDIDLKHELETTQMVLEGLKTALKATKDENEKAHSVILESAASFSELTNILDEEAMKTSQLYIENTHFEDQLQDVTKLLDDAKDNNNVLNTRVDELIRRNNFLEETISALQRTDNSRKMYDRYQQIVNDNSELTNKYICLHELYENEKQTHTEKKTECDRVKRQLRHNECMMIDIQNKLHKIYAGYAYSQGAAVSVENDCMNVLNALEFKLSDRRPYALDLHHDLTRTYEVQSHGDVDRHIKTMHKSNMSVIEQLKSTYRHFGQGYTQSNTCNIPDSSKCRKEGGTFIFHMSPNPEEETYEKDFTNDLALNIATYGAMGGKLSSKHHASEDSSIFYNTEVNFPKNDEVNEQEETYFTRRDDRKQSRNPFMTNITTPMVSPLSLHAVSTKNYDSKLQKTPFSQTNTRACNTPNNMEDYPPSKCWNRNAVQHVCPGSQLQRISTDPPYISLNAYPRVHTFTHARTYTDEAPMNKVLDKPNNLHKLRSQTNDTPMHSLMQVFAHPTIYINAQAETKNV